MTQTRIFINFPSNIGDAVMCLPALDRLRENYPQAKITAIVSEATNEMFGRHNFIDETLIYNKRWPRLKQFKFAISLAGKSDIFIDFKNTILPVISLAKKRTPLFRFLPKNNHTRFQYETLIRKLAPIPAKVHGSFDFNAQEHKQLNQLGVSSGIFIAATSRSMIKRYRHKNLKTLISHLEQLAPVTILGEKSDREFYGEILNIKGVTDLVGKTKLVDLFYLMKMYCKVLIAVDSSILHMAGYLGIPAIALFGPTDAKKYGPWGSNDVVLINEKSTCRACGVAGCAIQTNECMDILPEKIIAIAETIVKGIRS